MHMTNISKLDCAYEAYFKTIGMWQHVLRKVTYLHLKNELTRMHSVCLSDSTLRVLPHCEFDCTSECLRSCEVSSTGILLYWMPPIWVLHMMFKKYRVDIITIGGIHYGVEKLLAKFQEMY